MDNYGMDVGQSCALASSDHPWQIKLRAQSITGLLFNYTEGMLNLLGLDIVYKIL